MSKKEIKLENFHVGVTPSMQTEMKKRARAEGVPVSVILRRAFAAGIKEIKGAK